MLYVIPSVMEATRADVLENASASLIFSDPLFVNVGLRILFDIAFHMPTPQPIKFAMPWE